MPEKRKSEVQNGVSSTSLLSRPIVTILVFVCIILIAVFIWFVVLDQMVQETNPVDMSVQVSGNDVIVVVFDSENAQYIHSLHAYIEGKTSRDSAMTRDHIVPGAAVTFHNLAADLSGSQFVIIEKYARLLFT